VASFDKDELAEDSRLQRVGKVLSRGSRAEHVVLSSDQRDTDRRDFIDCELLSHRVSGELIVADILLEAISLPVLDGVHIGFEGQRILSVHPEAPGPPAQVQVEGALADRDFIVLPVSATVAVYTETGQIIEGSHRIEIFRQWLAIRHGGCFNIDHSAGREHDDVMKVAGYLLFVLRNCGEHAQGARRETDEVAFLVHVATGHLLGKCLVVEPHVCESEVPEGGRINSSPTTIDGGQRILGTSLVS